VKTIILLLLLSLCGCYTTVNQMETPTFNSCVAGKSIDYILKKNFTDEAYQAIKDIPVIINNHLYASAMASGTNFWSRVAGLFLGCGVDRKIIITYQAASEDTIEETIIHEYIHQLHDMTLDGNGNWIDEIEFQQGYKACWNDKQFVEIVKLAELRANFWITNYFGIDYWSEYIAYVGARCCVTKSTPKYLGHVFRHILRKYHDF
jgi:hypothetical protein